MSEKDSEAVHTQDEGAPEQDFASSEELRAQLNTSEYEGSVLMDQLYAIEALVNQARNLPMSASVLINRAELLEMVQAAHDAIPSDVQTANQIVNGADAIISRAQDEAHEIVAKAEAEAERIVAQAHSEAQQLVVKERIVVLAEERADQLIEAATKRATELAQGADRYSDRKLAELESELERHLKQIRSGREVLARRPGFDPQAVGEAGMTGQLPLGNNSASPDAEEAEENDDE